MQDPQSPWTRPPPQRAPNGRFLLWLAVLAGGGLLVWELYRLFPGALEGERERAQALRLLLILVLISSSVLYARSGWLRAGRDLALWGALALILVTGYAFQDELRGIGTRLFSTLVPGEPVAAEDGTLVVSRAADGHFYAFGRANGVRLRFLIDTGASGIVLSPSAARDAGIAVGGLDFRQRTETANGEGRGADVALESLDFGPLHLAGVAAMVNQSEMDTSLLGMAFLQRFASLEFRGPRLILRAH